ncbi:tol-pal system protein YbgF [Variovorax terrae]|uniref:Cell division coordinator CpoB n=1 Tax=Variovorax terrae TaxID=2923278 RepID=A0A9X2AM49_9BURK|nr:tol-pal system protein YbgF [Variovorax terrae]MCJ0763323.1 tol-pal system protein YbgF [Variovorax terrae]
MSSLSLTVKRFSLSRARLGRAALVSLACLWLSAAHAGLFDDDEARKAILDLRQRVESTREDLRKSNDDNAQMRRSLVDLQSQIESLRADLAKMTGQNEQLARDVSELQRRQKDIAQGVDDRLRKFEPTKVAVDGREFTADPAEKRDFEAALAVFRKGDFPAAQTAFVDFVKRYPQSGYGPSALFWLGNAQYATRDYKEAIANFRSLLAQAPDHARAPDAALSIANCQIELKDSRSARKTLEDLVKAYPQSEAAQAAKDRLTRLK